MATKKPKKPRVHKGKLSAKRRKLLTGIAQGLNISEAGRQAGYNKAQSAHRAISLMGLNNRELLARLNMPVEKLLKRLIEKSEAKETIFFEHQGIVTETREVEAHGIQLGALDKLARIADLYPRPEQWTPGEGASRPTEITISMAVPDDERAEVLVALFARFAPDPRQSVLDAELDEDEG